jgi:glycosyltransferase involved in cell wall biosynthesis
MFVMTSTLEGIPRCLMEACAMGVPVAAYKIAGIDQLIHHEKTGLLAPLKNKACLAGLWRKLLDEPDTAARLASAASDYVYQHYSAARMASEYHALFQELRSEA